MPEVQYTERKLPAPLKQKMSKKTLTLEVSLTDVDPFQGLIQILREVIEDERIHKPLRTEYQDKVKNLIGKYL